MMNTFTAEDQIRQLRADLEAARRAAIAESRVPWPWIAIPPGGIPFFSPGSVAAPNYGAPNQVLVAEYTVQNGWEGVLTKVMNLYSDNPAVSPASFVEGSGDIVWDYDVNRPLGAPLLNGYYLADYFHVLTRLGDLTMPWPVEGGIRLKGGDVIRQKAYTVANVTQGAPAFLHGALLGWVWPGSQKGR